MDNHFDSKGGPQNTAQGEHPIGQQNNYGVPYAAYGELAGQLAVTDSALASFFKIMEEQQVPRSDLDSKLREIAGQYKELLARVGDDQAAKQAIEAGDYAKAEKLLEDAANQHSLAAAGAYADNARLQRVQLRYAKAAAYWQKAAALLPEEGKKERALCLHEAGYDLYHIAKYKEALPLYEQSLVINRELGGKAGEGTTLNNISQIYKAQGDYITALRYLEQSLAIMQELGDKAGEGATLNNISGIHWAQGDYATALKQLEQALAIHRAVGNRAMKGATLNNISQIYHARGDYAAALKYLEQSLAITQEIGDKRGEGVILNNIGRLYKKPDDYDTALKYLEQSLAIMQEIGDRRGEAETSWNIGLAYIKKGTLNKAEVYISRAVQLAEELGHPALEQFREGLAALRAQLKAR